MRWRLSPAKNGARRRVGLTSTDSAPRTPGERLMAAYLDERAPRLRYEYEIPSGGRQPDFTVCSGGAAVICEVYEPVLRLPANVGVIDSYSPIRGAFAGRKRKQGRGARDDGRPYVVVLARTNSDIQLGSYEVTGALFGDLTVRVRVSASPRIADPPPDPTMIFGRGGRLQPALNRRFSAVAVISTFNPTLIAVNREIDRRLAQLDDEASEPRLRVVHQVFDEFTTAGIFDPTAESPRLTTYHNWHALTPLPVEMFGGPYDVQWNIVPRQDGSGSYERVATGTDAYGLSE
jgi:hypothetical protein